MIQEELEKVSKMFLEGMAKKKPLPKAPVSTPLVEQVIVQNKELVSLALGAFGTSLKDFAEKYDSYHPFVFGQLAHIHDGQLAKEMHDALILAQEAKNKNATSVLHLVSKFFNAKPSIKAISKHIASPPIRLLKTRQDRDAARNKSDFVSLNDIRLNKSDWQNNPDSFIYFTRFSECQTKEVEILKEKVNKLSVLGLQTSSERFNSRLQQMTMDRKDHYLGFHKITHGQVCAILGKVHGFCQNLTQVSYLPTTDSKFMSLCDIIVPNNDLRKELIDYNAEINNAGTTIGELIGGSHEKIADWSAENLSLFDYQPRNYPLSVFDHSVFGLAGSEIEAMINTLEAFPDFQNKPLFDEFEVVIPGVSLESKYFKHTDGSYRFKIKKDAEEKTVELKSKKSACFLLDSYLVKNKLVHPVILGKASDTLYFLNYWKR